MYGEKRKKKKSDTIILFFGGMVKCGSSLCSFFVFVFFTLFHFFCVSKGKKKASDFIVGH